MIFDAVDRTSDSPKLSTESEFQFMNRSARAEISRARDLLEELIAKHPDSEDLISRFRSGDNRHFRSAEFELLLFSLLHKQGFALTPHPTLPNGSASRPDFLVESPSGDLFYLEAVLASEAGPHLMADPLLASTLDVFSKHAHRNFNVVVTTSGSARTQPSQKRLLQQTMQWLDKLDPDEVEAQWKAEGHDSLALPSMTWSHEGLDIFLQALPLRKDRRGTSTRLLGAQIGSGGWRDAWTPIRDAVTFKGSKYGELDRPLVVAVNFASMGLSRIDEMQALFGQEQIHVSLTDRDAEPTISRAPNGAWIGKSGPQFRRVSGAWIFDNFSVYSIQSCSPTLYLHPWARRPLPADLRGFSHATGSEGQMSWYDGISPRDTFGLPTNWPSET